MYIRERNGRYGRDSRCFTYDGLHRWYVYSASAEGVRREVRWHTVERFVRRLAEDGYLIRVEKGGKKVIFCLSTG